MKAIKKLLLPLSKALAAFFRHDLTIQREAGAVKVALAKRVGGVKKPNPRREREAAAARKEQEELQLVRTQLAALLDTLPTTRSTFKQLALVEQAIGKKGLKALHRLPLELLQKAHEQLEGLVTNWSPAGLANLRSKMAVAILDREHQDHDETVENPRTAAVLDPREGAPDGHAAPDAHDHGPDGDPDTLSDDQALAAAYAALGHTAPGGLDDKVELQAELGSRSARALAAPVRVNESAGNIQLRDLAH